MNRIRNLIQAHRCRLRINIEKVMAITRIPILVISTLTILIFSPEIKAANNAVNAKNAVNTNNAVKANEADNAENETAYEEISVGLQVEGYDGYSINALYSSKDLLYISIEDLFHALRIPCEVMQRGDQLRGFIGNEDRKYSLDFNAQRLIVNNQTYDTRKAVIKQMGALYMNPTLLGQAFGLHLTFNFRALSIALKSDFELPAIKEQRLGKMRNNISGIEREIVADTVYERRYHILKPGTLDWSFITTQASGKNIDTRLGLGLGAEILGGEANVFLNYSDKYKFDSRMQQYLWRWVNNDLSLVRQVQVGKISNQSISSIYSPVVGAIISNTPTRVRKASGEYILNDYTQPNWFVELYINGVLTKFTKADASGMYTFNMPLMYGFSTLTLKFYGPMGEERSEERILNQPYNLLPAGEFEYRVSSGILQDGQKTQFARAEGAVGLNWDLTVGGGVEYLSSISSGKTIPFLTFSALPFSKLIIKGEYAHGVRTKGLLDYYLGRSTLFEVDYTKYVEGQQAILYNYLEERKASLSIPMRYKSVSGFSRFTFRQNVYKHLTYNSTEALLSAYYRQLSANVSTYANWIDHNQAYINTNVALSFRMKKGLTLRPSAQFNLTNGTLILYKAEAEKQISRSGYLSLSYEKNQLANFRSLDLNFRYNLPFAQTQSSARLSNGSVYTTESAQGGLAFGSGGHYTHASALSAVGRGGISLLPFLDLNHNGRYDQGERKIEKLSVRINGGRVIYRENDPIIRIVGLEPFVYYMLEINENDFENISWRVKHKTLKVMIDPNQFKQIEIPVIPSGEVSGNVYLKSNDGTRGLGRVLVKIDRKDGTNVAKILSEADGYLYHLGLDPGEYIAHVDSVQLGRLRFSSDPTEIAFKIKEIDEGDVVSNLNFTLSTSDPKKALSIKKRPPMLPDSILCGNIDPDGTFSIETVPFTVMNNALKLYKRLAYDKKFPMGVIRENGFYKVRLGYFKTKDEAAIAYRWMMDKGIRVSIRIRIPASSE